MPECVKFIRKVWTGWFVECRVQPWRDEDHRARRFISASLERVLFIFIKCWSCQLILLEECNPRPGILGKLFQSIWGEAGQNYCCHNSGLAGHRTHGGRGFHKFWLIDTQPSVWNVECLHRLVVSTGMEQGRTSAALSGAKNSLILALFPDLTLFLLDLNRFYVVSSQICRPIRLWWRV